jgi:hypothetical protein
VALEPHRREPGCGLCRRPCWYGFMVQRDLPAKAKALAARLKVAAEEPGFAGSFPRLVSLARGFAQDVTPFPVAAGHLHHLAYCYLVNSGAQRQYVLRGFQAHGDSPQRPPSTQRD